MNDRMPPLARQDMNDAQRRAADELIAGPRKGVIGPFVPLLAVLMFLSLLASLQLIQLIKRLFGYSTEPPAPAADGGWSSADHLTYYNAEHPDDQTSQWPRPLWPGHRSGQGGANYYRWRFGDRN